MKKFYLLTLLLFFTFFTNAQVTVQSVPRNDIKGNSIKKQSKKADFNFDDIIYWVGTGTNEAAFVVQWNDAKNPDALVWGFRWNGTATGEDMLKAIAKTDKRFFTLLYQGTQFGSAVGGLGFDLDGNDTNALFKNGNTTYPLYPVDGIINTTSYDFDDYTAKDADDHWGSGWYSGYWSYWVKDPADTEFGYSGLGASSRQLENGSWDVWNFNPNMESYDISSAFTPVSAYSTQADFTKGYFMVNEEWFGHTNGSVNFIGENDQIHYRVYSEKNNNQAFGATTQFGTIYGDKFYFISKQAADGGDTQYTPGGRLVVANATTMEKIKSFDNIGGGDGRSFVGVTDKLGYIGASNGIYTFDIENLQVGTLISGTGGGSQYAGQIGNMIRTSQYVFAVKQSAGVLIIDPKTNTLVKTISGAYHSIVQAKDGSVWAIQNQKLVNIDPTTFAITEYALSTATQYLGSWGAWNAGSFTYSNQQNVLYWMNSLNAFTSGTKVIKFDVTTKTLVDNFITIPGQEGTYKQIPYGAALRVDPVSDRLILNTTESGYGAHYQKNWIHTYSNTGALLNTKTLNDYYWFPAVTVFPDVTEPVVSSTFPSEINASSAIKIDLKTIVTDADNLSVSILKSIRSNSNTNAISAEINSDEELVLTPQGAGTANIVVSFNSNGKVVDKTLTIISSSLAVNDNAKKINLSIYPNPTTDILNLKTQDKIVEVSVFDSTGKVINTKIVDGKINVSELLKGNYILRITTDKATYQEKFIKK
ncbi:DUF5074 domain-containing protein [Epilithonimonas hungarica]|uniref:Por secretion system C-terminal sorting domain-containing protein n=1 Tax=Epilithonimonas hungarica TaxID=454006 RepID=A0A1G7TYE2_9FLAO|nr:DUF5074 domain-containing protein [Epilithonimonas hungarica]SDG40084.1 Por secretion system C-terminal sorting domain-containing protein [Epilithonimonas hungarica]